MIWTGNAPAQAVAVLVESPERQWRSRPVPEERVKDGVKSYVLGVQQWLDVACRSAPQTVARLVHRPTAPGRSRILNPNARGKALRLALRRRHHPLYEGNTAQWEDMFAGFQLTPPWEQTP